MVFFYAFEKLQSKNNVIVPEPLPQMLAVEEQRRLTVGAVDIMAHVDIEHPQIAVVEIIAATAVVPTVAALGKIAMRYGVELQGRERNEPLMTIGVNIHKSHKAEACDAEVETEVHHAMSLGGGVDISAHEVTAGVELHHVNALKAKRRRQDLRAIKL